VTHVVVIEVDLVRDVTEVDVRYRVRTAVTDGEAPLALADGANGRR
jgi:hypothetical protein